MEFDELELTWESLPLSHFALSLSPSRTPLIPPSSDLKASIFPGTDLDAAISLDSILPDDIIERILSFLPIRSVIRASATCKRWREIIRSRRRSLFGAHSRIPTKPWYFMFTQNESADGFAYDPLARKWFGFQLPCVQKSTWFVSSSCGLVCFLDTDSFSQIFVSNPITRNWTRLPEPSGTSVPPDYSTVAISLLKPSLHYTVSLVRCKQTSVDNFHQWELEVCLYGSEFKSWTRPIKEVLDGWRGGDDSVICGHNLYCLIQSTGVTANSVPRHRIMIYDLMSDFNESDNDSFNCLENSAAVPCSLTCGRLMNLKERLILVGGIAKNDRPDIIKGIGIWELERKSEGWNWREITKMPHKYFQGFGEFDDVFASSGAEDLVYIQSYGSTLLLVFEMERREWRWAGKCPVSKRFPLQLFTGFCFEPRLEVSSLI
ncbi:hypothetical protein LUZ60_000558 [Juncus effusus]|nr:hypothetical protein LUZ60_000558 [Juncus effusus]